MSATESLTEVMTEAVVRSLVKSLVRSSALPDWMQTPALGRDMRPLAEYLAADLIPVATAMRTTLDAQDGVA